MSLIKSPRTGEKVRGDDGHDFVLESVASRKSDGMKLSGYERTGRKARVYSLAGYI